MQFSVWLAQYGAVFLSGFANPRGSASVLKLAPQPLQRRAGRRLRQEAEPKSVGATIYDPHIEAR